MLVASRHIEELLKGSSVDGSEGFVRRQILEVSVTFGTGQRITSSVVRTPGIAGLA